MAQKALQWTGDSGVLWCMNPLRLLTGLALGVLLSLPSLALAGPPAPSLFDIPLKNIDGKTASLKDYQGKVLLIVNVASECGYTPQYKGLQALQDEYKAQGFTILGFPCNDFGGQEPGGPEEIKTFCSTNYKVTFPLFEKIRVKGEGKHPLYEALTGASSPAAGEVGWNFTKFLIGKDGKILQRFDSEIEPESSEVTNAIKAALAANK